MKVQKKKGKGKGKGKSWLTSFISARRVIVYCVVT